MILPLVLIAAAILLAGVVAYGIDPGWAAFAHGLDLILFARRYQWPLVTVGLLLCVALIVLVISGRKRAWWLIGLGPVLALFAHRFAAPAVNGAVVLENPSFSSASEAGALLQDDDYVVGLHFGDATFAYPYRALYAAPVIVQADRDKRMILMWSAFANRALAFNITRDLKARDVEIVSMPANALLLYDRRLEQFINGLKGLTPVGTKPAGFGAVIPTTKSTWARWRADNPATQILPVDPRWQGPSRPVEPAYPLPATAGAEPIGVRVTLVGLTQPAAVLSDAVTDAPLNLTADATPVFVFREKPGAAAQAFDRRIGEDLRPRFVIDDARPKRAGAVFADLDTNSQWSAAGVWLAGAKEFKGRTLAAFPVEDDLSWRVMKYWYPDLRLETVSASVSR